MDRRLTGVTFRVARNGKYQNVDISDMTEQEIKDTVNDMNPVMAKRLCVLLATEIKTIGNKFDIMRGTGYENI